MAEAASYEPQRFAQVTDEPDIEVLSFVVLGRWREFDGSEDWCLDYLDDAMGEVRENDFFPSETEAVAAAHLEFGFDSSAWSDGWPGWVGSATEATASARASRQVAVGCDRRMSITPEQLRDQHVVEAGVRQAWPFLTFSAGEGEAESRLYIDTAFTVEPDGQRYDDGDAFRAAAALLEFNTFTVAEVLTTADSGLVVTFDDQRVLRIDGVGAAFTTGEPWALHAV